MKHLQLRIRIEQKKLPYSAKKEKEKRTEQKKYICSPFLLLLILFVLRQKDPTINKAKETKKRRLNKSRQQDKKAIKKREN